jgi:iron complex outermembrane receptor protein
MMKKTIVRSLLCGTAITLALGAVPAFAQDTARAADEAAGTNAGDIIVTARRSEERLQDVPISITVFNQQQLNNRNVTTATDLATYTPSLSANNNFGPDSTSFAIRGFVQDIGTAPSVGTYFGDVVTPRGATNGQPVGDGASQGDFWDLQNVQVLKGPQGTLQGRNTTGGAVLFVPQKPTGQLEGYLEGGYGNYNMQRIQGVINVPLADTFLVRAGFDHEKRRGYLNNLAPYGPRHFGDIDYWSGRLSIVANLTPNLENYTIVSYNNSVNNGSATKPVGANGDTSDPTNLFGPLAAAQMARDAGNFYNLEVESADAHLRTTQWQVINTTTWTASDDLTVRNITSYAELTQKGLNPIFGNRFLIPVEGTIYDTGFQVSNSPANGYTASESTFTEEFRLSGKSSNGALTWQGGAYLEVANPIHSITGSDSPGFASCINHITSSLQCTDAIRGMIASEVAGGLGIPYPFIVGAIPSIGNVNHTVGQTSFRDVGLYAQATYKFTDQLKLTGGFRYTWDQETADTNQSVSPLLAPPDYGVGAPTCLHLTSSLANSCAQHFHTESQKPTWLIDLDYTPTDNILVYGKFSRGYRQSVIITNIPVGGTAANPDFTFNYLQPEKVDAYEIGAKTSWRGPISGTFNIAGFYNKFSNQQIQVGFLPQPGALVPQTSAAVNAGKSTIYGLEVDATLSPFRGLNFNIDYAYLHTRINEVLPVPTNPLYITQPSFAPGDPLALSPKHKFTLGATYTVPTDESFGTLSIGGSVTYRTKMLSNYTDKGTALAQFVYLPSLTLVDANVNWNNVASLPIDLTFFVTNLTNKQYYNFFSGLGGAGFEDATVGEPRMFGATIKYHFGR